MWLCKKDDLGTPKASGQPCSPPLVTASSSSSQRSSLPSVIHSDLGDVPQHPKRARLDTTSMSTGSVGVADNKIPISLTTSHLPIRFHRVSLNFPASQDNDEAAATMSAGSQSELSRIINACINSAWAASTVHSYNSSIRACVGKAEELVGAKLLPMDSEEKLMTAFACLDGHTWASIKVTKSSVRAWHTARGISCVFDAAWSDRVNLFWAGLKRRAVHVANAKSPLPVDSLLAFQQSRLNLGTPAGLRDAALAGFCFFGLRRSSEGIRFNSDDCTFDTSWAACRIKLQKNDPNGKGMVCFIPRVPTLGLLCPVHLLSRWFACWSNRWKSVKSGPLFCVTTSSELKPISYDAWRKTLTSFFQAKEIGTHSLRKGGTQWYSRVARVPESIIQAQGGWSSRDVMEAVYNRPSDLERAASLSQLASASSASLHIS